MDENSPFLNEKTSLDKKDPVLVDNYFVGIYPILDSWVFMVCFPDGNEKDVAYNVIAEHLFSQGDEEGNQHRHFKEIINHQKKKGAVDKADKYRKTRDNKHVKKRTTTGWDLEVQWKDGSTLWIPLKELKETNTIEDAEYSMLNRIDEEPAFDWWVKDVIKKGKRLIKLSKSKHIHHSYKFGIQKLKEGFLMGYGIFMNLVDIRSSFAKCCALRLRKMGQ